MSRTAVVLVALTAAGFPLLLWAIGRTVTAMGERAPYSHDRSHPSCSPSPGWAATPLRASCHRHLAGQQAGHLPGSVTTL
jgi:hypothetical protein